MPSQYTTGQNRWWMSQQYQAASSSLRWNETCVLVSKRYELDEEGVPQAEDEKSEVFCSPKVVGAHTWSSMYEIGISADAQIELRTCDYEGQRDVFYRDEWYSVEIAQEKGDFTVLTLRHQKSDSGDGGEEESDG